MIHAVTDLQNRAHAEMVGGIVWFEKQRSSETSHCLSIQRCNASYNQSIVHWSNDLRCLSKLILKLTETSLKLANMWVDT
jgi:hypothetical protein